MTAAAWLWLVVAVLGPAAVVRVAAWCVAARPLPRPTCAFCCAPAAPDALASEPVRGACGPCTNVLLRYGCAP